MEEEKWKHMFGIVNDYNFNFIRIAHEFWDDGYILRDAPGFSGILRNSPEFWTALN